MIVRGDSEMIHRVKMDVQKIYVGRSIEHERGFKIGDEGQMLIYRGNIVIWKTNDMHQLASNVLVSNDKQGEIIWSWDSTNYCGYYDN